MKEEAGIQALFFMDLNSKHLRGTTILLTSYWLTYCPCLTFKGVEFITSASNTVLFLAQDGVTYLGFFSLLYLLQGGYLLEMISMISARALCFINVRVRVSCHLIWEHSYFLNYSFVNNSCISSYVPMSHHSDKWTEMLFKFSHIKEWKMEPTVDSGSYWSSWPALAKSSLFYISPTPWTYINFDLEHKLLTKGIQWWTSKAHWIP